MKVVGQAFAVASAFLPLIAVLLSRSVAARGAVPRLWHGRSHRAARPQPPPHGDESERALVERLLAGALDSATYRERMTVLARREAMRWHRDELGPP
jgi:hypothetical protein